jgi:hypothetical protein
MMSGQQVSLTPILTIFISSLIVNLLTICVFSFIGSLVAVRLIPRIWKKRSPSPTADISNKVAAATIISMVLFSALPLATYALPNLDFIIVNVWSPGQPDPNNQVFPGKDVSIYVSIMNKGNISIEMLHVVLIAHMGTAFNITADQTLGQFNITNPIGKGETFNFSINLNIPSKALGGSYDVDAVVEAKASGTDTWVSRSYHRDECFIVSSTSGEQGQGQPFTMGTGESLSLNFNNNGSMSVAYAFGGLDLSAKGIILSQVDLNGIILAGFGYNLGELLGPLVSLPETGFLVICRGLRLEDARMRGDQLSSQFGLALNVHFTETSTLEIPISKDTNQNMSMIVYSPPTGFTPEQALDAYFSLLPSGGLSKLLASDKILQRSFMAFIGLGSSFNQEGGGNITSFAETIIDWGEGFSGRGRFSLSVKDTLGFSGKITSSIPNGSVLTVSLPESLNVSSLDVEPADAKIIGRMVSLVVNSSDAYDDLIVSFRARFPPSLSVTRSVQPSITSAGGIVSITIEVTNLASDPVTDVKVNDTGFLNVYNSTLKVLSGSPMASWVLLNPNESKTIIYSLRLGANGKYTLNPAKVTYSDQYGNYSRQSETTVITSNFDIIGYLQSLFMVSATSGIANLPPSLQQLLRFNLFLIALIIMIVLPPIVVLVRRTMLKHKPKEPKP